MRETGAHMWYRVALYMVRTNVSRHLLHPYCLEMVSPEVAPQRGAVGAGQVEQHVEQRGIMVEPAGQIIADVGIIGIAACGELRQCQMLAYQQRDPADDVAVESHAFHDHGRMPSAFRRMVGHPRSFADVMQMPASSSAS